MELPSKIGKYQVIEKLGQGGSGCVLKVEQKIIRRVVAMKVLFSHLLQAKPLTIRRFKREARLASSLVHPNIVPIFEIGEASDLHYYTMQYIQGLPMTKHIKNDQLQLKDRLGIFLELCDALALAHSRNIIHRDLKPHNVIITKDLHPVILDFGIAKSLIEEDQVTRHGHILGSAHYMAPEQAGPGEVGTYTDVFGLGVMLYEMLTRRRPFEGNNVTELIFQRIQYCQDPEKFRPPSLLDLLPNVPPELDQLVFRCLEAKPEDRYKDASEVLAVLQKIKAQMFQKKKTRKKRQTKKNKSTAFKWIYISIFFMIISLGAVLNFLDSEKIPMPLKPLRKIQLDGSKILRKGIQFFLQYIK